MKRVSKYIVLLLVVVIAGLGLSSCSKQQRREKFQIVSVNKVRGSISEGWRLNLTIANNTGSNVRITSGSAFVRQNGRKVARLSLNGEVILPRRRCSVVDIPLRVTLSNPIAALSTLNQVRKGNFSGISVDYNLTVSALTAHRIFEQNNVALEDLAKQFNFGLKK